MIQRMKKRIILICELQYSINSRFVYINNL